MKFKEGQVAYCIHSGVVTVVRGESWEAYPIKAVSSNNKDTYTFYTEEGKIYTGAVNPTLLTLKEARAKGYDVPKQKVKIKRWVVLKGEECPPSTFVIESYAREYAEFIGGSVVELTGEYEVEE